MAKRWTVPYKKVVLEYARLCGQDARSYREFGVSRSTFYEWKKILRERGAPGERKYGRTKGHKMQCLLPLFNSCHPCSACDSDSKIGSQRTQRDKESTQRKKTSTDFTDLH